MSPYIFILFEILAILIKLNKNIIGIKIFNTVFLLSQYADDTTVLLDGSAKSLRKTIETLKFYADISGLHVNVDKNKAILIGSLKNINYCICPDLSLQWEHKFKLLGVDFTSDLKDIVKLNFDPKIEEVRTLLTIWSKRILTPIGKNVVLKTLALSKLNHLFISLPNPSREIIKKIEEMFFNFLWNNNPDKVKRDIVKQDFKMGGLRVIDIGKFIMAIKCSWFRRYLNCNSSYYDLVSNIYPWMNNLEKYGTHFVQKKAIEVINPFWKDVFLGIHQLLFLNQ